MSDSKTDIFYQSAFVWNELTEYNYLFTYGYKNKLYEINLTFSPDDFPHLAGFQYLKDIALPRFNPIQTVQQNVIIRVVQHSNKEIVIMKPISAPLLC